jgi:hypothetical protein
MNIIRPISIKGNEKSNGIDSSKQLFPENSTLRRKNSNFTDVTVPPINLKMALTRTID